VLKYILLSISDSAEQTRVQEQAHRRMCTREDAVSITRKKEVHLVTGSGITVAHVEK
jgi:hypothetical protein